MARPEQISRSFNVREFAVSASRPDLVRPLPDCYRWPITLLARGPLQDVRDAIGSAVTILSGYRSVELNRAVGGSATSQHTVGEAADWTCVDVDHAWEIVLDSIRLGVWDGVVGQVIRYPDRGFVHLALSSNRYPLPTPCVHLPSHGLTYRQIQPNGAAYQQLLQSVGYEG